MTLPRQPDEPGATDADAPIVTRPPLLLLFLPYAVILAVAALTPTAAMFPDQGDVNLYLEKARALAAGQVPYRDFKFEYPPMAIIPMVVPYLLWPFGNIDLDVYKWLFAAWEAVLMLALGLVLARIVVLGGDGAAAWGGIVDGRLRERLLDTGIRLLLLTFGAALAIAWRFDLYPALLVMVAIWLALDDRPVAAGFAIGVGILAKLFPLAVVPALAIPWLVPFDLPRLVRYGAAAGATVLGGLLPFTILAGRDTFAFLGYQAERGLQIESIGGGLAVLLGLVTGSVPELSYGFSAVNVDGDFAEAWLALLPFATVAGFVLLGWLGWRRVRVEAAARGDEWPAVSPRTIVALAFASLLMLLVTSKVYSIQYVVWIVPFAALLSWRQFALAAVVVGLTMPIHPVLYSDLVDQEALPILVLNLRNALVVTLLGWIVADVARPPGAHSA